MSIVRRPILALAGCEDLRRARKSRLKGGRRQDCLPH
jgi:hypothetical protein